GRSTGSRTTASPCGARTAGNGRSPTGTTRPSTRPRTCASAGVAGSTCSRSCPAAWAGGRILPFWPARMPVSAPAARRRWCAKTVSERMTYAVVKTGGKQYRVEEGQTLVVERLPDDEGATIVLEPLLFRGDDKVVDSGDDLAKVKVSAKVVGH